MVNLYLFILINGLLLDKMYKYELFLKIICRRASAKKW